MLNNDTLAQLKQLKTDIRQHEKRFQGAVSGSQHNFGFVRADEGQQFFLPPLEMQKTFPGDRIEFQVKKDDKGREFAAVEKLLNSDFTQFCGKCVQHGKAWFVDIDAARMQRKLFLPPQQRKGLNVGDWLHCRVSRHPLKDGKGQAAVLKNLGQDSVPDFPSRYASINFKLLSPPQLPENTTAKLAQLIEHAADASDLPMVSIDPAASRDIDDALCAKALAQGWEICVAIADPGSLVDPLEGLGENARHLAATAYLPHRQIPMLPIELAEDSLSLLSGQERLALLCKLTVAADGEVINAQFEHANIRNRAQLSYDTANQCLEQQQYPDSLDQETRQSLASLQLACDSMRQWRAAHQLLADSRPEYAMQLNEEGRIECFNAVHKGPAQQLVEECMVATNQAAARLLAGFGGIFSTQAGLRHDRLSDAAKILQSADYPSLAKADDLDQLEHFRPALAWLADHTEHAAEKAVLSRYLQRASLSLQPSPHMAMGVETYMGITSPLRRYADLFNHAQLKRQIAGQDPLAMQQETLDQLQQQLSQLREASYWAEQWLKCEYLERNGLRSNLGTVIQANSFGLVIQLHDCGISGVLEKRSLPGKWKFDSCQLRFKGGEESLGLGDELEVGIQSIHRDKRRILFNWENAPKT